MIDVTKTDFTGVYDNAMKLVELYRAKLDERGINASGSLSRSADFDVEINDRHLAVYFILESYGWYVEEGRGRSTGKFGSWTTKYEDIQKWLRLKIGGGKFVPSGSHRVPTTDKEIKRVAGAIVNKITKYGFYGYDSHGLHPLKDVLDYAETSGILDSMIDSIVGELEKEIDVELRGL